MKKKKLSKSKSAIALTQPSPAFDDKAAFKNLDPKTKRFLEQSANLINESTGRSSKQILANTFNGSVAELNNARHEDLGGDQPMKRVPKSKPKPKPKMKKKQQQ